MTSCDSIHQRVQMQRDGRTVEEIHYALVQARLA